MVCSILFYWNCDSYLCYLKLFFLNKNNCEKTANNCCFMNFLNFVVPFQGKETKPYTACFIYIFVFSKEHHFIIPQSLHHFQF